MTRKVCETKAGQSISAWVILNKKGQHVATVQAHSANSGNVLVNVFDMTGQMGTQTGSANGSGYDKFTAALSGLVIDGHTIADHCGTTPECESARVRIMKAYTARMAEVLRVVVDPDSADAQASFKVVQHWADKQAQKIGARFANYDRVSRRFNSLFFESGLKRLQALGYTVIQAI